MIGRAARGNPWIFREINHYLEHGSKLPAPEIGEVRDVLLQHLDNLYRFYGEYSGVRIARKHIAWYSKGIRQSNDFRRHVMQLQSAQEQLRAVDTFLTNCDNRMIAA